MHRQLCRAASIIGLAATGVAGQGSGSLSPSVSSPDGRIRVEVFLEPADRAASVLRYRVSFNGRPVVLSSRLGVDLADGSALGAARRSSRSRRGRSGNLTPSSRASGAGASTTGGRS